MTVVADGAKGGGGLFEVLVAKWRVMDDGSASGGRLHSGHGGKESDRSDVTLRIDYQFSNPLYGALSSAVIPKVAEVLIEAFEKRAAEVLGKRGNKMPNSGQIGVKVGA